MPKQARKTWAAVAAGSAIAFLTCATVGWLIAPKARADVVYGATAEADGYRVLGDDPGVLPLGAQGELGVPSAQATTSSGGVSRSFASAPYPGPVVIGAPGLVSTQSPVPAPPYPLYAEANNPGVDKASQQAGPYTLNASARPSGADSNASVGGGQEGQAVGYAEATATVTAEPDSGAVAATADSLTEQFDIAGVLRIGRVRSTAKAATDAQGKLSRASDLVIEGVAVAGQAAKITPDGVVIGPTTSPLPSPPGLDVLEQHGISVKYLSPVETDDGIVAAGLEISVTQDTGVEGKPSVTYTIGRAGAFTTSSGAGQTSEAPPTADGSPSDTTGASGSAPVGTTASLPSSASPGQATTSPSPAPPSGSSSPTAAPRSPSITPRSSGQALRPGLRAAAFAGPSTYSLYVVLVVAGLASLVTGQLIRVLGVRQ